MEFEDQEEEQEEEAGSGPGYKYSLGNSNPARALTKMPSTVEAPLPPPPLPLRRPRYKECLKNHAVGIGGNAVDGCGEFMPAGEEGTLESLNCAACNCHRNFHRKENEPDGGGGGVLPFNQYPPQQQLLLTHHHPHGHFGYRGYLHVAPSHRAVAPLALPSSSGGGGGIGSRDEMEDYYSNPAGKNKRFRTRFTQEQKDKMLNLAERLDWKIQKQDEEVVQQFCSEVGVKRHVFKVWMHNNKHTLGKKT